MARMIDSHEEPTQRVRLLVAYDGSAFRGFARNVGVITVAGELEAHLSRVFRTPITVTGAGRTDAGVHAWGQVVTFDAPRDQVDTDRLLRSINAVCGPALAVREVELVSDDFDARFSARWRRYRYSILTSVAPNPFLAATSWHLVTPLAVEDMDRAGRDLVGQHDFASFCRCPPTPPDGRVPSLERTVTDVRWFRPGDDLLVMEITARAFCHQMVRSIVGTLVDIGRGRIAPDAIPDILAARERRQAGQLAPPQGLSLHEVGY